MPVRSCCKVGEVANRYQVTAPAGFDTINDCLVARWRGDQQSPETGLRPLADWFNKQLLKAVYLRQDRVQIDSQVESDYQILSSGEHTGSEWDELLRDLAQDRIDGEAVATDFVSSSTLHRHLKNCVGATKDVDPDRSDWERDRIAFISDWAKTNLCGVLSSLDTKGQLHGAGDVTVNLSFFLQCPECGRKISLRQALSQGYICQEHLPEEGGV